MQNTASTDGSHELVTDVAPPAPLAGKLAWVIGGGTGIGAGAARALAEGGARVVVSGRRIEELAKLHAELSNVGVRVEFEPVDVADGESVRAAHTNIVARHGEVGILVFSAGTNISNRFWSDTDPEGFARVVDVNLNGATRAVHAVLPGMRQNADGLIVLVSSWAGFRFSPGAGAAYSASKTALASVAETVNAQERLSGIRATHLCPGEVRTDILRTRPIVPSEAEQCLMLTPADVGHAVRFIAELPARVCINELVITPTSNTSYN